jgi:hypothetical protein
LFLGDASSRFHFGPTTLREAADAARLQGLAERAFSRKSEGNASLEDNMAAIGPWLG